jgi:nucleoside-diphosphate-sugar epimerase
VIKEPQVNHKTYTAKYVIFGTGPLGLSVLDALVERGKNDLILVNRSGQLEEALPEGVEIVSGEATDPQQVAAICSGAEVVFHCAQPGYTEWPEKFPPITEGILQGVSQTKARLVFGDNLYMYGPVDGPIHEKLPYRATGRKGKTRAAMAARLLEAHQAGEVQVAIGRGSDFFGPRVTDSAIGELVFDAALHGKTVNLLGDIDQPHSYTYIKDFGRALVELGTSPTALGQAWHVPNAQALSTRGFIELIERELGNPIKTRAAGNGSLTLLGLFVPELREMKEMLYEFEEPFVVDSSKFEDQFDTQATPIDEAVRETLAWYRERSNGAVS